MFSVTFWKQKTLLIFSKFVKYGVLGTSVNISQDWDCSPVVAVSWAHMRTSMWSFKLQRKMNIKFFSICNDPVSTSFWPLPISRVPKAALLLPLSVFRFLTHFWTLFLMPSILVYAKLHDEYLISIQNRWWIPNYIPKSNSNTFSVNSKYFFLPPSPAFSPSSRQKAIPISCRMEVYC